MTQVHEEEHVGGPDPEGPDDEPTPARTDDLVRAARLRQARRALERLGGELQDTSRTLDEAIDVLPDEDDGTEDRADD